MVPDVLVRLGTLMTIRDKVILSTRKCILADLVMNFITWVSLFLEGGSILIYAIAFTLM